MVIINNRMIIIIMRMAMTATKANSLVFHSSELTLLFPVGTYVNNGISLDRKMKL